MGRVVVPFDATRNVMELVEAAPSVATIGLVDLLIDVRVGIAWRLPRVDNLVAS